MGSLGSAMQCPVCQGSDTRVIDSRPADGDRSIRRRRACGLCDHRFTTYERSAPMLVVRKRSGRLEPFSSDKLRAGLVAALADLPVPPGAVDDLLEEIEAEAISVGDAISSERIGKLALAGLRLLHEVAYLRFASVYKDFKVGRDFERELAALEADLSSD